MSLLDDVFLDRKTPAPQLAGPQAGTVLGEQDGRLLVSLETFPDQQFACSWGHAPAHNHTDPDGGTGYSGGDLPPAGTRCLVLFAGMGIGDPWAVAFAGWPS